jgi:hypothetical protein
MHGIFQADNKSRLTLNQARYHPLFQREDGSYPDLSTVYRWGFRGVRGVKLEVFRVGGRILTTHSAIRAFNAQLNAAPTAQRDPSRRQQIARARRRLESEGI